MRFYLRWQDDNEIILVTAPNTDYHIHFRASDYLTAERVKDLLNMIIEDKERENEKLLNRNIELLQLLRNQKEATDRMFQSVKSAEKSREYWVQKYYKMIDNEGEIKDAEI